MFQESAPQLPFPPGPRASRELVKVSLPPQMGAGLNALERQIRESRTSLEKDVQALSELLAELGKETLGSLEHPQELLRGPVLEISSLPPAALGPPSPATSI